MNNPLNETSSHQSAANHINADAITPFSGAYEYLSNFYGSQVQWNGLIYPSVENAFQAAKTLDVLERQPFTEIDAAAARQMGHRLTLRDNWDSIRLPLMEQLVSDKFTRNIGLGVRLVSTGDIPLVNVNVWGDTFWGMCKGQGENHLGRILMRIREKLAAQM